MKKQIFFFVSLILLLYPVDDAEGQFDSCIQQFNGIAPGIEPQLYLSSSDSFYSYCFCFIYSQAHGVYESLDDSTLILTRTIPLDPPIYSTKTVVSGDDSVDVDTYQLRYGDFFPIINQELRITWKYNIDTTVMTDSRGFLIFPLHKARRVGIVDSLGRIAAYIDIQDLKEKKKGVIQIGNLKHEWVYKYYLIKTGIGTYLLKDFYSGEVVADGKACQDMYDPKHDVTPEK